MSQASEHDAHHGKVDPGFFTARKHFVVFGQPAPRGKPGERALHERAPLEDMEASWADFLPIDHGILGCPDPAQATPGMLHDLFHALAAIVAAPPPYTVISKQDPLAEGLSR